MTDGWWKRQETTRDDRTCIEETVETEEWTEALARDEYEGDCRLMRKWCPTGMRFPWLKTINEHGGGLLSEGDRGAAYEWRHYHMWEPEIMLGPSILCQRWMARITVGN